MEFLPSDGVLYLNVGGKHLRNLVVSLLTLRDHYQGPVAILSGDGLAERYLKGSILDGVEFVPFKREGGNIFYAKTAMHTLSPFERSIFLDADTTIHGDISPLLPETEELINWTQFHEWTTQTGRIQERIKKWRHVLPSQVAWQLATEGVPAINTGVLGFSRSSARMMDEWREKTAQNIGFICDEVCAQLLAFSYPHNVLDARFNCSPRFCWKSHSLSTLVTGEGMTDVRVVHNHGNKGLKPRDRDLQRIWLFNYFRAWEQNVGDIQSWDKGDSKIRGLGGRHPRKYVYKGKTPKRNEGEGKREFANRMVSWLLENQELTKEFSRYLKRKTSHGPRARGRLVERFEKNAFGDWK